MSRRTGLRNAHKREAADRREHFDSLASAGSLALIPAPTVGARDPREIAGGSSRSLLLSAGLTPREAWVDWLSPTFAGNASAYVTGTYSDDYGYANGLMLVRNVHKDFRRFLESFDYQGDFIVGVEHHQYRDILHLHGILQGAFSADQLRWIKDWWQADRGYARVLPVLDGCTSYVTKYALKGDTDSFEWRLS